MSVVCGRAALRPALEFGHFGGGPRPVPAPLSETKGRSLYQVVCRGEEWVGLVLWTGAIWHLKALHPQAKAALR